MSESDENYGKSDIYMVFHKKCFKKTISFIKFYLDNEIEMKVLNNINDLIQLLNVMLAVKQLPEKLIILNLDWFLKTENASVNQTDFLKKTLNRISSALSKLNSKGKSQNPKFEILFNYDLDSNLTFTQMYIILSCLFINCNYTVCKELDFPDEIKLFLYEFENHYINLKNIKEKDEFENQIDENCENIKKIRLFSK